MRRVFCYLHDHGRTMMIDCEWNSNLVCVRCGYRANVPSLRRNCSAVEPKQDKYVKGGVGTELSKILKRIGIRPTVGCRCHERAAEMDRRGIAWCEQHRRRIVGWLRKEAKRRKLPFADIAGYGLLAIAIRRAKRREIHPISLNFETR